MEHFRGWRIRVGILMLALAGAASANQPPHPFGHLPLSFERNEGQTDARVKFLARGPGYSLFLTPTQAVLSRRESGGSAGGHSHSHSGRRAPNNTAVSIELAGGNPRAIVSGEEKQPGISNYFVGADPRQWRADVPLYARVRYHEVYPGIDLVYYGNQQQLEFDVQAAPGADLTRVRLALKGIRRLDLSPAGDLIARTRDGSLALHKPVIYQTDGTGTRAAVDGRYVLHGRQVAIAVEHYDPTRSLIVDPTLVYSTYIGGTTAANDNAGDPMDQATAIAADADGNVYIAGFAGSTNFPTDHPFQTSGDSFIAKLNPSGTALVYATYFGGTPPWTNSLGLCDEPQCIGGIALDAARNLYVAGWTGPGFPTVNQIAGACDANCQSQGGAFIAKLNPSGSALVYSSLIGGASGNAIAVDSTGNAYMVGAVGVYGAGGSSADFPQVHPLQSACPIGSGASDMTAYLLKVNSAGSALVYSTCIGGSVSQQASGVAVDATGNVYVAGNTSSPDFPVVNQIKGACVGTCGNGTADAVFVSKVNPAGTAYVYSTLIGGSGINTAAGTLDQDGPSFGGSLALDTHNNVYVTGTTITLSGANDFPTTAGAYQTAASCLGGNGCANGFLFKINAAGNAFVYSTYLGSTNVQGFAPQPGAVAVDASGNAAIVGSLLGVPEVNPVTSTTETSGVSPNIAVFDPTGAILKFSTPFYEAASAVAFDSQGNVYLAGFDCSLFPVTSGAFDTNCTQNTVSKATVSKIFLGGGSGGSAARGAQADYLGEGKSGYTVWRPSTGDWYSIDGAGNSTTRQWGAATDLPVIGDFDGDGKSDFAVFRPSTGYWYIVQSSNGDVVAKQWGASTDMPVAGDFDGDGKTDIAVFRPSTGYWYIVQSSNGEVLAKQWGESSDTPVVGDFDGDGKSDIAVFRPSTGYWYIVQSTTGDVLARQWGAPTDIPVSGDFDGDGKTDIAVFRPSTGYWYIVQSSNGEVVSKQWGAPGDVPVARDYDGDGKSDIAVWRPSTGYWYVIESSSGQTLATPWGAPTDIPVNSLGR